MTARKLGRLLIVTATLGIVASIGGAIAGLFLIHEFNNSLGRTLDLTAQGLTAVDDSLAVAADAMALVDDGMRNVADTSEEVVAALDDGAQLLDATADVASDELAPSLTAVEGSLPQMVAAAGVVDTALSTLARLPIGVQYDPDEPLDESLREVQTSLAGTGEELVQLSALVRDTSGQLEVIRDGAEGIAGDLAALEAGVADAQVLIADYAATTEEASDLLQTTRDDLTLRTTVASALVVALAASVALGQVALLWVGRRVVHFHETIDRILGVEPQPSPSEDVTPG